MTRSARPPLATRSHRAATRVLRRTLAVLLLITGGFTLTVVTAPSAQALLSTLYVAEGGSDTNDCSAPATACATITHALTLAASGATIEVSGTIHDNVQVPKAVTISGANAPAGSPAVIDGSHSDSVFFTLDPLVTFESLQIQHGSSDSHGGGIWANGPVTLIDTTVTANTTRLSGGGIYSNVGLVTLLGSTVSGNATTCTNCAGSEGGGLYSTGLNNSAIVVIDSTVSGNTSRTGGGGIGGFGDITVTRSTISGNTTANRGGGIHGGDVTLTNSTVSGNSAIYGSGVFAFGPFTSVGSTITANAGPGAGFTNELTTVTFGDTILANNAGGNCDLAGEGSHQWVSLGHNLTDDADGTACGLTQGTDIVNADPALGPLADNGGPTQTMMPAGAAAIGRIPLGTILGGVAVCPSLDQRGFSRPAPNGTACAIGAVEPGSSAPVDPEFSVSPTSKAYGSQQVSTASAYQTFTVTNTGGLDLEITTAALTGTDPAQFTKGADTCTSATVAPAGTCTVQVRFSPSSVGAKSAALRFTHNADGSPSDVALTGAGTAPPIPGFSVSPSSKAYGNQALGSDSPYQTFTVTNTGGADLTIATAALTGTDAGQFEEGTDTCAGATVVPAATCTVQARFSPTSTGAKTATLRFTHNAAGTPSDVALAGTGTTPGFSVSPTNKTYGDQVVGTDSAYQTFTVTNTGDADLAIATAALTGTDPSQFEEGTDTCAGATVPPAGTCTVQARFSPASTGAKTATLRFTHNAVGSPADVSLTGTGTAPAFSVSPTSKAYGDQLVGTDSAYQTFTVTNTGDADLTIAHTALAGSDPGQFDETAGTCAGATVAPSGTCTVQVRFSPTTSGGKAATLRFTHDAAGSPSDVALTGTGITKLPQVITFTTSTPAQPSVGGTHDIDATGGGSGNPVTFAVHASTTNGACTVNASTGVVQFVHVGSCVIAADQTGNANYFAAPQKLYPAMSVAKGAQAITFSSTPPAQPTVGGSHDIDATGGGSGNPVTFSVHPSTTNSACTVNASTGVVQFLHAGTCVIGAVQAGDADHDPAPQKLYPAITVTKGSQAITFTTTAPATAVFGGSHDIDAIGGASGNPVTFSVHPNTTKDACTVNATTGVVTFRTQGVEVFPGAAAVCVIAADQAGNADYQPAPRRLYPAITVTRIQQAITFTTNPPAQPTVGGSHDINATGGASGNPITYSVHPTTTTGACTVNAGTGVVQFLQPGSCVIAANQAGDASHAAATQRLYSTMTVKRGQEIEMASVPNSGVVGWTVQVRAAGGGSGNPVTFTSTTPAVCTVTPSGSLTYLQAGACTLTINQAGNGSYWPGTASKTIQVFSFGILF